jgi:type II secretory pathway component PulM
MKWQGWYKLRTREQLSLIGAAIFIAFLCYIFVLYSPLAKAVATKRQALQEAQTTLTWMMRVRQRYPTLQEQQAVRSGDLGLAGWSKAIESSALKDFSHQLRQTQEGHIQLSFSQVPFALFIPWLHTASKQLNGAIQSLTMTRTGTEGMIKAEVTIVV